MIWEEQSPQGLSKKQDTSPIAGWRTMPSERMMSLMEIGVLTRLKLDHRTKNNCLIPYFHLLTTSSKAATIIHHLKSKLFIFTI
ncbi:hypothetical protein CLV81_3313 [Flagellimonas meridianipacifica]|uniref:Uncharacterized protein n=1 Tax=Flagellimonas meridianipacifica TaxID=1080225 RepID=A0A2T0MBN7_9FLAO|nr:hypothetical protein CLV81_3313 [Allomuricauda pacifica]